MGHGRRVHGGVVIGPPGRGQPGRPVAGVVAAAEIQGTAKGSDGTTYTFDADMRFMKGRYVATDGRLREASFGFV